MILQRRVKNSLRICSLLIALMMLQGCSDWWTYNFNAHPQRLVIIPHNKLEDEVRNVLESERSSESSHIQISQRLADQRWGTQFTEVAQRLYGWNADFCELWLARNHPDIEIDKDMLNNNARLIGRLKKEFWNSYLQHVYYDVMRSTKTLKNPTNSNIDEIISKIVTMQLNLPLPGKWKADSKEAQSKAENTSKQLSSLLSDLLRKIPSCTTSNETDDELPLLSSSFLTRFLRIIDNDHGQLLIDFDSLSHEQNEALLSWMRTTSGKDDRALTVSKILPASISPSVKRQSDAEEKEKPFILQLAPEGQEAVVSYAAMLNETCNHLRNPNPQCDEKALQAMSKLLEKLNSKETKGPGIEPFSSKQAFELNLSTALNSPDIVNRLDYVSSYVQFYSYPYPANGQLKMEKEFWLRLKMIQMPRFFENRSEHVFVDLDTVWNQMRVKIEKVETLVQLTPVQEVAQVSRESTQGIEVKPEPSIELKGTVKGKLEGAFTGTSSLKSTVSEKILKELDRRSTWLSPERNILRLTQRGMEAINIAGTLKENVSIHIPTSMTELKFLNFQNGDISVERIGQPIYKRLTSIGISLAVVREPFEFHRSASEKFGLPDSADAYYIVVVSPPIPITLWEWNRVVDRLSISDLDIHVDPSEQKLDDRDVWFFSPIDNLQGPARIAGAAAKDFRRTLRSKLLDLTKPIHNQAATTGNTENKAFTVKCVSPERDNPDQGVYILIDDSKDRIWLGKERIVEKTVKTTVILDSKEPNVGTEETYNVQTKRFAPFQGDENDFLRQCKKLAQNVNN